MYKQRDNLCTLKFGIERALLLSNDDGSSSLGNVCFVRSSIILVQCLYGAPLRLLPLCGSVGLHLGG